MNKYEGIKEQHWKQQYKGLLYAILYGLTAKLIFCSGFSIGTLRPVFGITTLSFLVLVPLVMGLIVGWHRSTTKSTTLNALLAVAGFLGFVLLLQESLLYVLVVLPVYVFMAVGGSVAGSYLRGGSTRNRLLYIALLAPFFMAPVEHYLGANERIYAQSRTIAINASEDSVWQHIIKVEATKETLNKPGAIMVSGFPRPVKAAFDRVTTGGSRKAFFDRGLIFTETITAVVPGKTLAFTIKADPGSKPLTELEKRVIVEGKYFEVLQGRYEIETVNEQQSRLHMTVTYRLSTHFNVYCNWWAKIVMDRIQESILQIVKQSSETSGVYQPGPGAANH